MVIDQVAVDLTEPGFCLLRAEPRAPGGQQVGAGHLDGFVVVAHAVGGGPPGQRVALLAVASQVDHQADTVVGEGVEIGGSEEGSGEAEQHARADVPPGHGQAAGVVDHAGVLVGGSRRTGLVGRHVRQHRAGRRPAGYGGVTGS